MSASSSSTPDESFSKEKATRQQPRCRHFGLCGGCQIQDLPYERQLEGKAARVAALLAPLGLAAPRAYGSPELWYYRNKMEFSFIDVYPPEPGGPTLRLGLKPRGRWYQVFDLEECFLFSPQAGDLARAVRAWAEREKVPPYNNRKNTGLLRHLVVREAKNGTDRMVNLVTSPGQIPTASFVEAVRGAYPATSVLWGVNGKVSDTAIADSIGALYGPDHIIETLAFGERRLRFRISPQSFFQTNTRGAELLYGILRGWLKEAPAARLLDLYCGGGGIGLCLADVVGETIGVELNESAVVDARANAELNRVRNATFYCGAVQVLLPSLLALKADVVVIDPPRAGLHPEALKILLELAPPRLFYVSCNPEALARDLKPLLEKYAVEDCAVVDLFPHTEHVETAVRLALK